MKPLSLRLLNPPRRLLFVATATSGILFFENIYIILPVTLFAVIVFLSCERPPWRSVYFVLLPTTLLYFVGNTLFSPPDKGGFRFLIFCLNSYGLQLAIIRALRIGAVLLISLAWINSTPIYELYASVAPLPRVRPWVLSICRNIQLTRREFLAIGQSLGIRGMKMNSMTAIIKRRDWSQVRRNIVVFLALLRVIVSRQFRHIAKATLAWERHHPLHIDQNSHRTTVEANGVFVRYTSTDEPCVRNANLDLGAGSVLYVAGRAGAGKSTLLRALGGIIPRVSGELSGQIWISGVDTSSITLGQYASLATYTDADVESNILGLTVGQEMLLLIDDETRARRCLEVMGIDHLWERETTKLSGGQQVRLLLAGSLASEAGVIILDDPLDQLDPSGCRDFVAALSKLVEDDERVVIIADRHFEYFLPLIDSVLPIEEGILHALTPKTSLSSEEHLERWGIGSIELELPKPKALSGRMVARMTNVCVSFDREPVLKRISLEVAEGEVLVIQGPNGSGKTTAMLTLAGAINPTEGEVERAGRVGYLFQDASSQIVASSVFDELALAPRMQGCSETETEDIVSVFLKSTGLSGSSSPLDLHPQEVKILAMTAMSIGVELMILDEPSVNLDRGGTIKVMEFIEARRRDGLATVVISHDDVFTRISDRVLQFDDGRCIVGELSHIEGGVS
jgi:energy-coupling factor transport system ATP-binding protein